MSVSVPPCRRAARQNCISAMECGNRKPNLPGGDRWIGDHFAVWLDIGRRRSAHDPSATQPRRLDNADDTHPAIAGWPAFQTGTAVPTAGEDHVIRRDCGAGPRRPRRASTSEARARSRVVDPRFVRGTPGHWDEHVRQTAGDRCDRPETDAVGRAEMAPAGGPVVAAAS